MAGLAPQNQSRNLDGAEQSGRQLEAIGTRPVQNIDRRRFNRIFAHALRPTGECACAAVEVDHLFDRSLLAGMECGEIGFGHVPECAIVFALSRVAQDLRPGRLGDRQAEQWNLVPECDGEHGQAAKRMADEMHWASCAPNDGLDDFGFVRDIGIVGGAPFSRAAISEQTRRHAAKAAVPLCNDGSPRGSGTA